ncbi:hypothetical protein QB910_000144 [Dabrowskivirus KKP3916]|uniref:Defence against restriction A C-terminal domain-containing protein n=1 Tax=Alicyclobacillus phage KKP_3916 TaxID=3040651 RepID=A0AAT9V7T4_9CAUD|nr:hypothetical protein QB910_000144 [Alicyclobacillus phage KKP 3916]
MTTYKVANRAFETYEEAMSYCDACDFNFRDMIEIVEDAPKAGTTTIVYQVETTKHDEDVNFDFSNLEIMEFNTIEKALYVVAEWTNTGYNNINITVQIKNGDQIVCEDSANALHFAPEVSKKKINNLIDENEKMRNKIEQYEAFVKKYSAEKLFDEFKQQNNLHNGLYWYEMRLRGVAPGCQPRGFVEVDHNKGRHGIIGYSRKLSNEELAEYEMTEWNFIK